MKRERIKLVNYEKIKAVTTEREKTLLCFIAGLRNLCKYTNIDPTSSEGREPWTDNISLPSWFPTQGEFSKS